MKPTILRLLARKPRFEQSESGGFKFDCPACGSLLCMNFRAAYPFCAWCGQKIDWNQVKHGIGGDNRDN